MDKSRGLYGENVMNDTPSIDYAVIFKKLGFKYRYVYILGFLDKPEIITIVDDWTKDIISTDELEKRKRLMMREHRLPVINIELEQL